MSKEDLMNIVGSSSVHALHDTLLPRIQKSSIVKIYTTNGDCIKVKGDKHIFIIDITSDYITVKFDSHISDIMFNAIEKIEYYGGQYGRYDNQKITKE